MMIEHEFDNEASDAIQKAIQPCGTGDFPLWEPGLPAMNENAVQLLNRNAAIAGKPCSHN